MHMRQYDIPQKAVHAWVYCTHESDTIHPFDEIGFVEFKRDLRFH